MQLRLLAGSIVSTCVHWAQKTAAVLCLGEKKATEVGVTECTDLVLWYPRLLTSTMYGSIT